MSFTSSTPALNAYTLAARRNRPEAVHQENAQADCLRRWIQWADAIPCLASGARSRPNRNTHRGRMWMTDRRLHVFGSSSHSRRHRSPGIHHPAHLPKRTFLIPGANMPDENSPTLCLQRLSCHTGLRPFQGWRLDGNTAPSSKQQLSASTLKIPPSSRDSNAIQAIRHSSGEFTGLAIPAAVPSSLGSET